MDKKIGKGLKTDKKNQKITKPQKTRKCKNKKCPPLLSSPVHITS